MTVIPAWFAAILLLGPPADAKDAFRVLRVHVTGVDGRPVSHRNIDVIGLERWCIQPGPEERTGAYWTFVTDRHGNARVPIGDFAGWLNDEVRPGWGVYALVVKPGSHDAGGVSSRVWLDNCPTHQGQDPRTEDWAMEWGPILAVPAEGLNLDIQLQRGFSLKGRVVDDQHPDAPLAGVEIDAHDDLEADTHTGEGGYIFFQHAVTNANGEYSFPHLFRAATTLGLKQPAIWLKSNLDGTWQDEALTSLDPPANGDEVHLLIGATTTPRFRYTGRVIDEAGKPAPNVTVDFYVMAQSDETKATFDEEHSSQQTLTKADGTYEFMSPTPWVIGIGTEFVGDRNRYANYKKTNDRQVLAPGAYDLQLAQHGN